MKLRFSLRTLSIIIAILCIAVLVPLALQIQTGRVHISVANRLLEMQASGKVKGQIYIKFGVPVRGSTRVVPAASWRRLLGIEKSVERVQKITLLNLSQEELNRVIDELSRLDQIPRLQTERCVMTSQQLGRLLENTSIPFLGIAGLEISGDRMPYLRNQSIQFLTFQDSNFGNQDIDDLPTSLLHFSLSRCDIDDEGLVKLTRLKNLRRFHIWIAPATREGCQRLQQEMPDTYIEYCLDEGCASPRIRNPEP